MTKTFFTPGPSELYFTVEDHIKKAIRESVPSMSHRSKAYQMIHEETVNNLRSLLSLPSNFHIFFTGSATEIWERVMQNLVQKKSFHFVNGSFSDRFQNTASTLNINTEIIKCEYGHCIDTQKIGLPEDCDLIAFTQNETSTGAAQPLEDIYYIRDKYPDKLIAVDVVSSIPYVDIDYSKIDTALFSVQKCFGLPAGLGVWIVNEKCIDIAKQLQEEGRSIGSYHNILSLLEKGQKNQTPETPNMLGIYLLGKVAHDMLTKGISKIRQETDYKAALLYHTINEHPHLSPFVTNDRYQSKTVVVSNVDGSSEKLIDFLSKKGMIVGGGYGTFKDQHIRIANFPTHSKEKVELLVDTINTFSL